MNFSRYKLRDISLNDNPVREANPVREDTHVRALLLPSPPRSILDPLMREAYANARKPMTEALLQKRWKLTINNRIRNSTHRQLKGDYDVVVIEVRSDSSHLNAEQLDNIYSFITHYALASYDQLKRFHLVQLEEDGYEQGVVLMLFVPYNSMDLTQLATSDAVKEVIAALDACD